jgi:transcriptional regulator with XRE-family HTH domain
MATIDDRRNDLAKKVGRKIDEAVTRKGLVLKYLYGRLEISPATMQNWLKGRTLPDLMSLIILAEICDEGLWAFLPVEYQKDVATLHNECEQLKGQVAILKELLEKKMCPDSTKKSSHTLSSTLAH